jgi:hypothetical protein
MRRMINGSRAAKSRMNPIHVTGTATTPMYLTLIARMESAGVPAASSHAYKALHSPIAPRSPAYHRAPRTRR